MTDQEIKTLVKIVEQMLIDTPWVLVFVRPGEEQLMVASTIESDSDVTNFLKAAATIRENAAPDTRMVVEPKGDA